VLSVNTGRVALAVAASALALVGAACSSNQPGDKPGRPAGKADTATVLVKLDALRADECYAGNLDLVYRGCVKYTTQLGNAVPDLRDRVGGADQQTVKDLQSAVDSYQSHGCGDPGATADPCVAALRSAKSALDQIATHLSASVPTS
jgi:hypothetical protein